MFLTFFYTLRARGIAVTPTEWLGVCRVLRDHAAPNLHTLYHVARSLCVKHETLFDVYDQAFAEAFDKTPRAAAESPDTARALLRALEDGDPDALAQMGLEISPELAALLWEHREALSEMLGGADRDVEGGLRTDEEGGKQSALAVARQRRFKNYRSDVVLDTRTIQVALSRLRRQLREGPLDELDLEASIDATCRNAGEIELEYRRRKNNGIRIVLLMDAGGTMTPHARLVNRLFSAARNQFRHFKAYYFHNCPYDQVYEDIERRVAVSTEEMMRYGDDHWLIVVGDAHMNPLELVRAGAAVEGEANADPGLLWLQRIRDAFPRHVWLNPLIGAENLMSGQSVLLVQSVFRMYPLSLDGLDEAVKALLSGPRMAA